MPRMEELSCVASIHLRAVTPPMQFVPLVPAAACFTATRSTCPRLTSPQWVHQLPSRYPRSFWLVPQSDGFEDRGIADNGRVAPALNAAPTAKPVKARATADAEGMLLGEVGRKQCLPFHNVGWDTAHNRACLRAADPI